MVVETCIFILIVPLLFVLFVRREDIAAPEATTLSYAEERRAAIFENLRDLLFEFRVGKLSEGDYLSTKRGLQKELIAIAPGMSSVCSACSAIFPCPMKFCGSCGKALR